MANGEVSFNKKLGIIAGAGAFILAVIDGLNGFAGLAAVQPFATKGYVENVLNTQARATADAVAAQLKITEAREIEVNGRLANLQMMSLEMSLQLIDGQLAARRGEQVDLQSKMITSPNDNLNKKRMSEVQANIDELLTRRALMICYLDVLRGFKRDCR